MKNRRLNLIKMAIAKRKKRFFDVEIPLIRKTTNLQAFEIAELEGRYFKYDLTRILKGKALLLRFKAIIKDDKATSIPVESKLMPSFLKRMVRKGTNYIEDSFSVECEDATLTIKPFLISRRKISKAVRKALREKAKAELIEYVKTRDSNTLFDDLLKNQIQKPLSLKLKKVYPLSLCEIRVLKVTEFKAEKEKTTTKKK